MNDQEYLNEQSCPYEAGDVIWYAFGMPGYDCVPRLVISKNGAEYLAYDPFLDRDVAALWHPNTGHSIGDSGLHREVAIHGGSLLAKIADRASATGLSMRFSGTP